MHMRGELRKQGGAQRQVGGILGAKYRGGKGKKPGPKKPRLFCPVFLGFFKWNFFFKIFGKLRSNSLLMEIFGGIFLE